MNHRERVLKTLQFKETDSLPCDLMEGFIWRELADYFQTEHGLDDPEAIRVFLDLDFRWVYVDFKDIIATDMETMLRKHMTYSDTTIKRELADVHTVAELQSVYHNVFDPESVVKPDYAVTRQRWPDHALVVLSRIPSLFMTACTDFGMEECLVKMMIEPDVFEAYLDILQKQCLDMIPYILHDAKGLIDICWIMDDVASQRELIMNPELWRKYFKPRLAEQVRLIKEYCPYVIFHSCGAVHSILPDLIEIGINTHLVFQTSADNMDAGKIANEFGGRLSFYGGIDIQKLLRLGSQSEVVDRVCSNASAFAACGGYLVANSHHRIADIKGENIIAMCREAHRIPGHASSKSGCT